MRHAEHPLPFIRFGQVIIRQTFMDRSSEAPATLHIEMLDGTENAKAAVGLHAPPVYTCEKLDKGLQNAGLLVAGASFMYV